MKCNCFLGIINALIAIAVFAGAWYIANMPKEEPAEFRTDLQNDYGYDGLISYIRNKDMKHMNNSIYLDFTGAGLYRTSQMTRIFENYKNHLFANPHSASPASEYTTNLVEQARDLVLDFVGAPKDKYSVIFTASATASLRLIAESFPWSSDSLYMYTRDNHNSVLGVRRFAKHYGATFKSVDAEDLDGEGRRLNSSPQGPYNLFAFPAEENFAGRKYPLEWIKKFSETDFGNRFAKGKWFTLLDASAFLPTCRLDLSKYPADFVVMSFYKIFGYPNLGALVVRNEALEHCHRMGFSGGTVVIAGYSTDYVLFNPRQCSKYEDGTVPFLSIVALIESFKTFNELGIDRISKHTWMVTRELFVRLSNLRHSNGLPAVKIYGNHFKNDQNKQGAIVTVNFMHSNGSYVGYNTVMKAASNANINIRTGCFCNPGACTRAAGLNDSQVESYYKQKTSCHDAIDIVDGVPLGAVRISPGMYTKIQDIMAFEKFVIDNFVE